MKKFAPDFLARLDQVIPPGIRSNVINGLSQEKPTTFRINTLKSSPEAVLKDLRSLGVSCEEVRDIPLAYKVVDGSYKKLSTSHSYEEGKIYLQSLSSQLPPLLLDPKPGEKILDMAAAPGGKTCQIAALMKNQGEIVACEPDQLRFERLNHNIKMQGATIVTTLKTKAEKLPETYHHYFDRILLDAPCSSEGTFVATQPQTHRHWNLKIVQDLSQLQWILLQKAFDCLRPGGTLVYSTCALSPEENEVNVTRMVQKYAGQITVPDFPFKKTFLSLPLPGFLGQKFDALKNSRRIYPSAQMEGFFVSIFKKK